MTATTPATNLEQFFLAPENTTTRERIFFNRLSFDLKLSAARAGYHLHLYEPDVDRDGFDIVVEDEDTTKQIQTKAVLSSVGTNAWHIAAGLLRPNADDIDTYGHAPVQSGRAGGVILIEIDNTSENGTVSYSYTDYEIIVAIANGYLLEDAPALGGKGRPPTPARQEAVGVIKKLWSINRTEKAALSRKLFVRLANSDQLLGVIGMRSNWSDYAPFAVKHAISQGVKVDSSGRVLDEPYRSEVPILAHHIEGLVAAQPNLDGSKSTKFKTFEWVKGPHVRSQD